MSIERFVGGGGYGNGVWKVKVPRPLCTLEVSRQELVFTGMSKRFALPHGLVHGVGIYGFGPFRRLVITHSVREYPALIAFAPPALEACVGRLQAHGYQVVPFAQLKPSPHQAPRIISLIITLIGAGIAVAAAYVAYRAGKS